MSAHTKGPWTIPHRGENWLPDICSIEGTTDSGEPIYWTVATCNSKRDECDANAKLISAAPDFLQAAIECMDTELGDMACIGSSAPAEHALGLLKAAIAKTKGQQP